MSHPTLPAAARGASRLAIDATLGVTDLVEAMHARIASLPGLPVQADERTRGITGWVYRRVRGVTHLVGQGLDLALDQLPPLLLAPAMAPQRQAVLAALNGVLGDHLAATGNPLLTPMGFYRDGRPVALDAAALRQLTPKPPKGVLVLVHGLCMNDLQWQHEGHDHGALLAREHGLLPLYLRYSTGQPIAHNGAQLAALLGQLQAAWPHPDLRLVLLGHSMGGLVLRSALHQDQGQAWAGCVSHLLTLGSPHLGAPLERAGAWVDLLLGAAPYAAPLARLGRVRSAGINSLRHGQLLEDAHAPVPLPAGIACHAFAGTLGEAGSLKAHAFGDGLVPLTSALGQHRLHAKRLDFAPENQHVFDQVGHIQLLSDVRVGAALVAALGSTAPSA